VLKKASARGCWLVWGWPEQYVATGTGVRALPRALFEGSWCYSAGPATDPLILQVVLQRRLPLVVRSDQPKGRARASRGAFD